MRSDGAGRFDRQECRRFWITFGERIAGPGTEGMRQEA